MEILKEINVVKEVIKKIKSNNQSIGFVPTMGYLHEGHLSLLKKAKEKSDVLFLSIFVNPIQFGPNEDLDKYPRDLERDVELAKKAGVDYIFFPNELKMYPPGYSTYVMVEKFTEGLCGAKRLGHFKGVSTIVLKLFNIIRPDIAVFGKKDAQQLRVIEKMVEDLNLDIEILGGEIVREKDGLALSSRNKYLTLEERKEAVVLNKSLELAELLIYKGEKNSNVIIEKVEEFINSNSNFGKIDYVEIVDYKNFEKISELSGEILIAIAVYIGNTRLIDNRILNL
ncbi:pantoate--beta-alanine ligase [Haliovirga abyssi]|uniref:Pantothenate synthetase n=1 Tax=Haliovirga abyssi TaxID=2996794 RepID=A0AAU9DUZ0_9FUSO|nr:pantoate--beta-alanine ligase [Haliovirga abyssi]BDU49876.1 pantothenate synthetase [Haliovirga abyssi]